MQHPTTILRPTLKAFFVRATKHWSIVGLIRQSCYKNHCWCSTTVSDMTQSISADQADSVQLTRLLQCCIGEIV